MIRKHEPMCFDGFVLAHLTKRAIDDIEEPFSC